MSRYAPGLSAAIPTPIYLPPPHAESKRDRKRRETVNKIETLHEESWRTRDEKFSALYKEYHNENKSVNSQPPTSARYHLQLYPATIERDALLEAAEIDYQYKVAQAKKMYESERESIEAQYWDARDQVRQRLLGAVEERRRKLREEKEGGDVVTAQIRPRPTRRMPFRNRLSDKLGQSSSSTPHAPFAQLPSPPSATVPGPGSGPANPAHPQTSSTSTKHTDLLLHTLLAPSLAAISTDDIINPSSSSLAIIPASSSLPFAANGVKRGPRGKGDIGGAGAGAVGSGGVNGDKDAVTPAPGTLTALAMASGQQSTNPKSSRNAGAQQGQWVLGKSLAELKKMEMASQLEMESDWARINGSTGRGGRRARAE